MNGMLRRAAELGKFTVVSQGIIQTGLWNLENLSWETVVTSDMC